MHDPQSQLVALKNFFAKPTSKESLRHSIITTFNWARDVVEDDIANYEEQGEESARGELQRTAFDNFTYCRYHDDLVREAIRTIPSPEVISEADIRNLIESTLVVDPENHDFDVAYAGFLDSLEGAVTTMEQHDHIFLVGTDVPWRLDRRSPFQWNSRTGYQLSIPALGMSSEPSSPHPWGYPDGDPTFGSIKALATKNAFDSGSRACTAVACAIVQMLRLGGCWKDSREGASVFHGAVTEPREFLILRSALDTYFAPPSGKDTTERRLANGLHLWCLAEQQTRPGLRISLAVASLEAMLGEKGEGVGRILGDRVAVLLCTEPDTRNIMANFVRKDLYALRSKVLHGTDLQESVEGKRVAHALRLTALVFRTIWEHYNFMRRIDNSGSPGELFGLLDNLKWSGKPLVVLPESVANEAAALCSEIKP